MSHIERKLSHGGTVRGTPQAVAQAVQIDDEMVDAEREATKILREKGVKAAHPDDGWVNRDRNTVRLEYPLFNDKPQVGDVIALGWSRRGYRLVRVTKLNFLDAKSPVILPAELAPGEPWSYSFELLGKGEVVNDRNDSKDLIDIGTECFGLADGSVLNWRGVNYVPQKPSLKVRLHNWWIRRHDKD